MAAYLGYTMGWRRRFVADQLWLTTRIREEEDGLLNKISVNIDVVNSVISNDLEWLGEILNDTKPRAVSLR